MPSIAQLTNEISDPATQRAVKALFDAVKADDGRLYGSATWDAGNLVADAQESKDVTVTGAALGDFAIASLGVDNVDIGITAAVTAANTVTVTLSNATAGAVDLTSTTVYAVVFPRAQIASRNLTA